MKKVLVTGVFNVLHPGHVRLFRFAKECGDYLIVAVQSDKTSVQPIHVKEQLRLESVESNSYVNESFITNDTPEELIKRLKPDVLVKGREHEARLNPEEEVLAQYGGELLFESGEVSFSSIEPMLYCSIIRTPFAVKSGSSFEVITLKLTTLTKGIYLAICDMILALASENVLEL